ncbi:MAG: 4-(cytidine 5'-diphospho)-2-C-methyl-D-erythritol kinase [Dehalococcoidia bacterium]|jgi:4-diphosphocytidyl-2-C-methyl-D-erythritol kinase
MLTVKAPAKINLVLEVLGKRGDGYHETKSIMQAVSLFDILSFEKSDRLEIGCNVPALRSADNLVIKAAEELREKTGCGGGARIRLEKAIPLDSGLGGGSSDAAAALVGLNKLWSLSLSQKNLAEIAADVGSDVPFFIYGGTCMAEGRGERITPLPDIDGTYYLLVRPDIKVEAGKTGRLYSMLGPGAFTAGRHADNAGEQVRREHKIRPHLLYNAFDKIALYAYHGMEDYWTRFSAVVDGDIHLAGSGPALFAVMGGRPQAEALQLKLGSNGIKSYVVASLGKNEA